MKYYIILFLVFFSMKLQADSLDYEDSSRNIESDVYSKKLDYSINLTKRSINFYDSLLTIYEEKYKNSKKQNNARQQAEFLHQIANYIHRLGNNKLSLEKYAIVDSICRQNDFFDIRINNYLQTAKVFQLDINFSEALENLKLALRMSEVSGKYDINDQIFYYIAENFYSVNDYESAIFYLKKSIKFSNMYDHKYWKSETYLLWGEVLLKQKNMDSAFALFKKSLQINKLNNDSISISNSFRKLSNYYIDIEKYEMAHKYCDSALFVEKKLLKKFSSNISSLLTLKAYIFGAQKDYENSLSYNLEAYELRRNEGVLIQICSSLINIGTSYMKLKEYEKSKNYLLKALSIAEKINSMFYKARANKFLYEIYELENNTLLAFKYFKEYHYYFDLITQEKTEKNIALFKTQYELEKEKRKNETLKLSKANDTQMLLMIIAILVVIVLITLFLRLSLKQKHNKQLKENNQKINIQKEKLRSILQKMMLAEEKFKTIVTNINSLILNIDNKGIITLLDGEDILDFQLNISKLEGRSAFEIFKNKPEIVSGLKLALSGKKHEEIVLFINDFFKIWYSPIKDGKGNSTGAIAMLMNITDKVDAIGKLEESESRYKKVFDNIRDGILILNHNGKIIDVNPKMIDIYGGDKGDLINKMFVNLKIKDKKHSKKKLAEIFVTAINSSKYAFNLEFINKKNQIGYTECTTSVIRHENWETKLLIFLKDITERKNKENELKEYQEHLAEKVEFRTKELNEKSRNLEDAQQALKFLLEDMNETSKMLESANKKLNYANNELQSFSYSISHDLKAPLRAIDGFSHAIEEEYYEKFDDEGKEYIELVRKNTLKMGLLIQDLLEFSRIGKSELRKTKTDMREVFAKSFREQFVVDSGKKMNFILNDIHHAFVDSKLIIRAIDNLLSNAIKFSKQSENPTIEINSKLEGELVIFSIKDNGIGFDMKYLEKMFGVFQRLHSPLEFEGTGVGLAIVKKIINKHGGNLWAEGEVNKGATIFFSIPNKI